MEPTTERPASMLKRETPPTPLEQKLDELIDALHSHTQAVFMWADACNALLNALLQNEEADEQYITDLKGRRIPVGTVDDANRSPGT